MSDPTVESIQQHFQDLEEQGIHPRPKNEVLALLKAEEKRKIPPPPPMKDRPVFISYSTEYLDEMRLAYYGDPVQLSAEQFPKPPATQKPQEENAVADEQPR